MSSISTPEARASPTLDSGELAFLSADQTRPEPAVTFCTATCVRSSELKVGAALGAIDLAHKPDPRRTNRSLAVSSA